MRKTRGRFTFRWCVIKTWRLYKIATSPERLRTPLAMYPTGPCPRGVAALMTHRHGGQSRAPYDTLNLGDHVGDDPVAVAANRRLLCRTLGVKTAFLQQVHGEAVHVLRPESGEAGAIEADIAIAQTVGLAATIMVADCLPILFAHRQRPIVAAAHAGWRGWVGADWVDHAHPGAGSEQGKHGRHGVVARTLSALQSLTGQTSEALVGDLCVWLGPCIGPQAFEVGEEVRAAFIARHAEDACYFVPQGKPDPSSNPSLRGDQAQGSHGMTATKYLADLPGLARAELARLGVRAVSGNDGGAAWCTVANAKAYFSYRRDQSTLGGSGRMAALVWLTG